MYCWGSNKYGQLGLGATENEIFKIPIENSYFNSFKQQIKQIASGYNHTLILLEDGTVLSCGNNDYEQLGHDGTYSRPEKIKTLEIHNIVQIACGYSFSLALNNRGQLFCWGSLNGQLNNDNDLFYSKSTAFKGPISESPIVQIACGYYHFLALTEDGKIFVMGLNDYGQLGIGPSKEPVKTPIHLKSLQGIPVLQIATGAHHSFVLSMSGNIFSFGKNK
jgi:E3 ubiquitin-protein ligase HERC4